MSTRAERIAWMLRRPKLWHGWPPADPRAAWQEIVEQLKRLGFVSRKQEWKKLDVPDLVARARRAQQLIAAGHSEAEAVRDADSWMIEHGIQP